MHMQYTPAYMLYCFCCFSERDCQPTSCTTCTASRATSPTARNDLHISKKHWDTKNEVHCHVLLKIYTVYTGLPQEPLKGDKWCEHRTSIPSVHIQHAYKLQKSWLVLGRTWSLSILFRLVIICLPSANQATCAYAAACTMGDTQKNCDRIEKLTLGGAHEMKNCRVAFGCCTFAA